MWPAKFCGDGRILRRWFTWFVGWRCRLVVSRCKLPKMLQARIVRCRGGGGVVRLRQRRDPSRDRSVWVPGWTHLLHDEMCFLLWRDGSDWCWVRDLRG